MARFKIPKLLIVIIIVIVVGVGAMRWTGLERPGLSMAEESFREILAPLQSGVTAVINSTFSTYKAIFNCQEIVQRNEALREKVEKLEFQNNRLEEYRRENERLYDLLDFKNNREESFELMPAHVIGRNPSNWYNSFTVDVGKRDGLEQSMVVMSYRGLVGRILKVSNNSSEVLTVLDQASAVGALVQETRVPGVVERATEYPEKLQMVHLSHDAELKVGQTVITSGLGGVFPHGLRIGHIQEIISDPDGLVKKAIIEPRVDFDSIEEVLVITDVYAGD